MMTREQMLNKNVVFRLTQTKHVYPGTVVAVEPGGFWLESIDLMNQLRGDIAWVHAVREFKAPQMFIPDSALMFLIVEKETPAH
jgi:hypothetical protein